MGLIGVRAQGSDGIAPPAEDRAPTVIEGQLASDQPPPPPEQDGLDPGIVLIIALLVALVAGFAAFRFATTWAVSRNWPYSKARGVGFLVGIAAALLVALVVSALAGQFADAFRSTTG